MITLLYEVKINGKTPEQIFQFIAYAFDTEKYKQVHPKDHIKSKTIKDLKKVGGLWYFDEALGGHSFKYRLSGTMEVVDVKENEQWTFRARWMVLFRFLFFNLSWFPWFPLYYTLELKPINGGTKAIQKFIIGDKNPGSKLICWVISKVILTDSFKRIIDKHIYEEFKGLEKAAL